MRLGFYVYSGQRERDALGCNLEMRLEIELCFGTRNSERVGLALAPEARFAAPAAREAAERRKHLAADIVRKE
jgi:hypothetical protein